MAVAFHTFISSIASKHIFTSPNFGHWSKLLRLFFFPNMPGVLLPKDVRYPLANTSTESVAMVTSPAHFHIVDFDVSQSFPRPELGPGSHLS